MFEIFQAIEKGVLTLTIPHKWTATTYLLTAVGLPISTSLQGYQSHST